MPSPSPQLHPPSPAHLSLPSEPHRTWYWSLVSLIIPPSPPSLALPLQHLRNRHAPEILFCSRIKKSHYDPKTSKRKKCMKCIVEIEGSHKCVANFAQERRSCLKVTVSIEVPSWTLAVYHICALHIIHSHFSLCRHRI